MKLVKNAAKFLAAFAFMLLATAMIFTQDVEAKETKLSSKELSKFDDTFKDIATAVPYYTAYCISGDLEGTTVVLDFSKNAARKKILDYRSFYSSKTTSKASTDLFGKSTSGAAASISGDWGDGYPKIGKKTAYKTGTNKYKVVFEQNMVSYDSYTYDEVLTKIATITMYLKKSSKSANGFIITKMEIAY
ncbi:MAG: hypothetical protein MJ131_06375 [Lachnospiraceae bacterium]|nr:hypothetical protein [Lachnospiraceae bacterium]